MKLRQKLAVLYLINKFRILAALSTQKAAANAFELFCTPPSRNLNKIPAVFEEAEKLVFTFQGYSITGYRWNKGAGRKALIVHGFQSSVINFDQYIDPLRDKGYEILAFDAPAHGRSSGKTLNALVYRDFIKYIDASYGPIQSYIAHSLGGLAVCMAMAETTHDESYRLALLAPVTEMESSIDYFFRFLQLNNQRVRHQFGEIITQMGGNAVAWYSVGRTLQNIKSEILWLHDEEDTLTPLADALKIKEKNRSNIKFVITKGLGHRGIYRDKKIGKAIADFV